MSTWRLCHKCNPWPCDCPLSPAEEIAARDTEIATLRSDLAAARRETELARAALRVNVAEAKAEADGVNTKKPRVCCAACGCRFRTGICLDCEKKRRDERDTARTALAAAERVADRLRHKADIESDHICPDALRADAAERDLSAVRERLARLTDLVGRVVQEAKHHHLGRGNPLYLPGALPWGLRKVLLEIETATEARTLTKEGTATPPQKGDPMTTPTLQTEIIRTLSSDTQQEEGAITTGTTTHRREPLPEAGVDDQAEEVGPREVSLSRARPAPVARRACPATPSGSCCSACPRAREAPPRCRRPSAPGS